MSGRETFQRFSWLISALATLAQIIPRFICVWSWDVSKPFSGQMALLLRYLLLKRMACRVGNNVYIGTNVNIKNVSNLSIGDNVSIHDNCYLDSLGGIFIGTNVSVAHNSTIISFDHSWSDQNLPIKYNQTVCGQVVINDDVWIGAGVRILKSVRIESRVVVAAGAVLVGGVYGPHCILGGVPARVIKGI